MIEQLESTINENYLKAERSMLLRTLKTNDFNEIVGKIYQWHDDLIGPMASTGLWSPTIVSAPNNKQEFDTRRDKWLSKIFCLPSVEPNMPSTSMSQGLQRPITTGFPATQGKILFAFPDREKSGILSKM